MNKIAIISDIHGNLPALEAVFNDISNRNVHKIICLGDIVGKGPNCAEVVDLCKEKCDIVITGNWEKFLADTSTDKGLWYKNRLGKHRIEYLRDLPESIGFYLSGKLVRLFHAHPHDVLKRVNNKATIMEKDELFQIPKLKRMEKIELTSDIVGYGDIHGAFIDYMEEGKILFNTGSIGMPYDYLPMASYVILEGEYGSVEEGSFSVSFQRVIYDIDLAVKHANETDLPYKELYIKEIKSGVYSR